MSSLRSMFGSSPENAAQGLVGAEKRKASWFATQRLIESRRERPVRAVRYGDDGAEIVHHDGSVTQDQTPTARPLESELVDAVKSPLVRRDKTSARRPAGGAS